MDFNFLRFAIIGGAQAALILITGHYFPWTKIIGKPLPILWRYIYGITAVCFIGYPISILHLPEVTDFNAVVTLVVVAAMGGAAVCVCYAIDQIDKKNQKPDNFVNDNYKDAYDELKNGTK